MAITVYRVEFYNVQDDEMIVSTRWFTRAGAERVNGLVIESTETQIDEKYLEPGEHWTARGFNPRATA
jgi:hypothetical protein